MVFVSPNSSVFCFVVVEQPTEPVVSTERFSITAESLRFSMTVVEGASRFSMIVVLWFIYGYSLAFTEGNAFFGGFDRLFMKGTWDNVAGRVEAIYKDVIRDA